MSMHENFKLIYEATSEVTTIQALIVRTEHGLLLMFERNEQENMDY